MQLRLAAAVCLLALILRLGFLAVVADPATGDIDKHVEDAQEYLLLAENLAERGCYTDEATHVIGLYRTPGYPLFLALFRVTHAPAWAILVAQAVINSFGVGAFFVLLDGLLGRRRLAMGAALLAAASPTALSLSALILTDLLFATVFLCGFLSLTLGVTRASTSWSCGAALLFSAAAYIKPTAFYWLPAAMLVWICLAAAVRRHIRWPQLGAFAGIQLTLLGAWVAHNYVHYQMPKFSLIGEQTMIDYLGAKVTAVAKGEPHRLVQRQEELRRMRDDALAGGTPYPTIIARQMNATLAVLRAHPRTTLRVYLANVSNQTMASCKKLAEQTGWGLVGPFIFHGERLLRWLAFSAGIVGLILTGCEYLFAPSEDVRRRMLVGLAFSFTFAYFLALSGVTFWTGSRILYVGEFALLGLVATILPSVAWIWRPLGRFIQWMSVPNDELPLQLRGSRLAGP